MKIKQEEQMGISSTAAKTTEFAETAKQQSRSSLLSLFSPKEKKSYRVITDSLLHYGVAWGLLSIYGGRACPFVEGINAYDAMFGLGVGIVFSYILRMIFFTLFKRLLLYSSNKTYIFIETAFFVLWGLLSVWWGVSYEGFHLDGILKAFLGASIPGFFFSIEMLNARERHLVYLGRKEEKYSLYRNKYFSLRRKILLFGIVSIGLVGITIILTTYKNFLWTIEHVGQYSNEFILWSVFKETAFVIGIFFGLIIKLIVSYSKNISLYFLLLTESLDSIVEEKFSVRIPITTYDEFAILSGHVNSISREMEERGKIKQVFGKIISPVIAKRLLQTVNVSQEVFEDNLVILFSDIRGFTRYSESRPPREVVEMLNSYFTEIVSVITENDGVVDKFMGDGVMAIFGLEKKDRLEAALSATKAAIEMHKVVEEKFPSIKIGVGIHEGMVTAGLIGAPDRKEFTVIGDTVNTASRLESATKELEMNIVVSQMIYEHVSEEYKEFQNVGNLKLKGKEADLTCYGLAI